jgi:hypothetical protein
MERSWESWIRYWSRDSSANTIFQNLTSVASASRCGRWDLSVFPVLPGTTRKNIVKIKIHVDLIMLMIPCCLLNCQNSPEFKNELLQKNCGKARFIKLYT